MIANQRFKVCLMCVYEGLNKVYTIKNISG